MRALRTYGSVGGRVGNHRLYPAGDGVQRPLVPRSRFPPRLMPGVRLLHSAPLGRPEARVSYSIVSVREA